MTDARGCCWFAGVGVVTWRQIGDDQGVVAAGSDVLVLEMADVLDGPLGGKPDGVKEPVGSGRVPSPAGAVSDRQRPAGRSARAAASAG